MRWVWIAPALLAAALSLDGCARGEAHEFPASDEAAFNRGCPTSNPICACTWDEITHRVTAEQYEAAMERFQREGLMEPEITHARAICRERHLHD